MVDIDNIKIEVLHGYVIVPGDYIVVDKTRTPSSDYAGVISEKKRTLPHFLVFFDKPVHEQPPGTEDKLLEVCEEVFPGVLAVRAGEVEPVFDDAGMVVNGEEFKNSSRLGLFPVPEVPDEENLYLGTGIIRR